MESVIEFKEWILAKCRVLQKNRDEQDKDLNNLCGALTPQNIPEFVIPGSGESSRRDSSASFDLSFQSLSPRNSISSNRTSPAASIHDSSYCLEVPGCELPRSAPVSPKHEVKSITSENTSKSLGFIGDTNADPLSFAAMSLPHFKAQTSFGFSTLSQSPHTRRKESLFHVNNNGLLSPSDSRKLKSLESLRIGKRLDMINSLHLSELEGILNKNTPSVVVTPSGIRKNKHSPLKSSPQHRTSKNFLSASPNSMPNCKRNNRYFRRRSSLVGLNESPASSEESILSDASSTNSAPDEKFLSTSSALAIQNGDHEKTSIKRHSSPQISHTKSPLCDEKPRSSSCTSLCKPALQFFTEYGELKFAFQYLATSRQLKVTLIKAENLGGYKKTDSNMNAYAKICLMPGKIQKQTSELHKHTRNPMFNQEFYFQGLTIEQLHAMNLRIKVFHKPHNLRLQEFVGKVDLELDSYDILTENRMWKDLDSKREKEDLGSIGVSLAFEPKEGTITVTSPQVKGLPQHQITGPPDPYVRVEVSQPGRSVSRKQTKTKKSTTDPVFNETFTFTISPKVDDIRYTIINITVFDHERIRSDEVIGQIRIGYGATQDTEIDHWNEVTQSPGQEITKWHSLMDNDEEYK